MDVSFFLHPVFYHHHEIFIALVSEERNNDASQKSEVETEFKR